MTNKNSNNNNIRRTTKHFKYTNRKTGSKKIKRSTSKYCPPKSMCEKFIPSNKESKSKHTTKLGGVVKGFNDLIGITWLVRKAQAVTAKFKNLLNNPFIWGLIFWGFFAAFLYFSIQHA